MFIQEITMHNWGPYYGTHTLKLRDTVYAVQAMHENDPERSNWIGKSWYQGAIRFQHTGDKPATCPSEDGWISWGERDGHVEGLLSDGTRISRTRSLGRSTQLTVTVARGKPAKQEHAQEVLYKLIGMTAEDLMATCFIEQRQIARLILSDPAERTKIVNGWMELEPLQRAEDWLRTKLNELLREESALGATEPPPGDVAELQGALTAVRVRLSDLREARTTARAELAELAEWRLNFDRAVRFRALQVQGKDLRAKVDAYKPADVKKLKVLADEARDAQGAAQDREYQLRELVQGEWDGKCPKTCEDCPAADHVKAVGASMSIEHGEAESVLDAAAESCEGARKAHDDASAAQRTHEQNERELARVRKEATDLLAAVEYMDGRDEPPDARDLQVRVAGLDNEVGAAERTELDLQGQINAHANHAAKLKSNALQRAGVEDKIRTHREALTVVGRQGAQREIAEWVLAEIERGANALLTAAGIDLTVQVSWAREGRGLATNCDACGAAYSKSQAVKVCDICGAPRGPKLVEKLVIEPNDRSGAADDIAGLSFQLSASNWLRSKRTAAWSVTCIDEPFGQLDRSNARALSTHLHAMIRGSYAFKQGFLVAHDASVMEALPARIQIHGAEAGSTIEVIG